MSDFNAGSISATLTLDRTPFEQGVAQARATGKKLAGEKFTVTLDADASPANRKVDELRAKVAKLSGGTIAIDADTAKASSAISGLQAKVDRLSGGSIRVDADTSAAANKLNALGAQLARLTQQRHTVRVDADTARAQNQLNALGGQIQRIAGQRASAQVDADTALARAQLAAMQQALNRLDGQRANANVGVSGGGQATTILAAIVAGLGAVGAAAPAAAAALAAIPSALGVAAQGIGAVMSGFSGVGDAMKAVESQEKSGASTATSAAKQRASAARQIANAQAGVQQAEEQAARAAIQGAQQVGDAQVQLQQARQQQARTAVQGASQIASAERQLASTVVSVRERIVSAEAKLQNAQRSRQYAQEALTRATEDATRANRDLQLSVSGAALSEERATLSLAQARKRLADNKSTDPLETADLSLSVREAEQNLKEVQNRYSDLQGEQSKWARTGVQGSDQVVQATRALEDAQRGVGDAQKGLTSAQVQGAQQIADAQRNVQETVASVAQANADAADAVAQAQQGVQRAVQQAAWSQQDSARSVASAQRALADAYASAAESATGGASATNKAAEALAKLSPAGREFVDFLQNEWKPAWEQSSKDVAERMLPGIEAGMRSLLKLQPMMTASMSDTGVIIGDLASRAGALMDSGPFRRDFANIMASNNRMISDLGEAGLSLFGAMTSLAAVAGPVVERFTRLAEYSAQAFESWIIGEQASGDLERGLQSAGDTLMWLGGLLIDVAGDVLTVAQNLAPLGAVLLESIRYVTDFAAGLTDLLGPAFTSVVAGAGLAVLGISKLGTAMGGLALAQGAGGIKGFATVMGTVLNPAALNATTAMSNLRDGFAKAGYAAGSNVANLTGMAGAAEKGYAAGSKLGGALTKVGSALPLVGAAVIAVGLAYDALTVSASEAADALLQGGAAGQKAMEQLAYQDRLKAAIPMLQGWVDGVKEGVEAAKAQYDAMTNLGRAQVDATQAQNNYELAVRNFGSSSPQAISALGQLNDRSRDVEIAQIAVKEKTDLATAAILYQRDQMLGTLDANLRKRQATQDLARDQKALADAIKEHGPASAEAEAASIQLEQTQLRAGEAARSGAGGMQAYAQSIGEMVAKTNGQLSPTLAGMVQSLDWAGLSAAGAKVQIDNAGNAVAVFPNGKTVTLDANTSLAVQQVNFVRDLVNSTRGTIGVDADTGPGVAKVGGFKLQTDATTGVVTIAGNITPADQARLGIQAKTDGTTGTMWINGNPVPCDGKLNGMRVKVDGTTGTMTIDGDPAAADRERAAARDRIEGTHGQVHIGANYDQAKEDTGGFWGWIKKVFTSGPMPIAAGGGLLGAFADGGLVAAAAGRHVQRRASGGLLRGPGTGTSDSILGLSSGGVPTARVSNGEYVVRAAAVRSMGVPAMDAINAMGHARGGLVGLATGGLAPLTSSATADPTAAPVTAAPAAVSTPMGDPTAATATAAATDTLAASMGTATAAAATLTPMLATLAATQASVLAPSTDAVTLGQQNLVAAGVNPLVASLVGTLFPTLGTYQQQVGVAAPLANTALQTAQTGTQVSTNVTAANTALNSTLMAGAITAMALTGQAQHAGLRAGQALTMANTSATATNTALNSQNMAISTTNMSLIGQSQLANLRTGQSITQQSTTATALNTSSNNANMIATTGNMSATNQNHLAGLRGAQGVTNQSTVAFADSWRAQLGRTMPDSANPIRWVINVPIRSITDAWNTLDAQFALGKHVNPPIAAFASGGTVNAASGGMLSGPGTGTSDSMLARVSNGEFVVREQVAKRVPHFLNALNSGQAEAVRAAGGTKADPFPQFAEGGAIAARQFAEAQRGKPYVWGAVGPNAYDCSGLWSAIVNTARGQAPYRRLGVAAGVPWPGFVNGLNSSLTMGGNSHHTAGTIMGLNAEARQTGTPVLVGGNAAGADSPQFTRHVSLPSVGGQFVSGGPGGGGGGFDPTPVVNAAFAKAYREIGDVPRFFGPSAQVARDQGIAKTGADQVKGKAMAKLSEMFAGSGLFGPVGDGAAFIVRQISDAARAYQKGVDGATIGVATGLVESNLRNLPGGDRDSVGVFQQRPSQGWGTIAECMNVLHAAGSFFSRFPGNWRAMDPGAVAQSVQRSAFPGRYATRMGQARGLVAQYGGQFDDGGWLPGGVSLAYNGTGKRENKAVFTEDQWKTMQGQAEAQRRGNTGGSGELDYERLANVIISAGGPRASVTVNPRPGQSEEKVGEAVRRELDWAGRTM